MVEEFDLPAEIIDRRVTKMKMISPSNREVDVGKTLSEREWIGMCRREVFDDYLRKRAAKNGAKVSMGGDAHVGGWRSPPLAGTPPRGSTIGLTWPSAPALPPAQVVNGLMMKMDYAGGDAPITIHYNSYEDGGKVCACVWCWDLANGPTGTARTDACPAFHLHLAPSPGGQAHHARGGPGDWRRRRQQPRGQGHGRGRVRLRHRLPGAQRPCHAAAPRTTRTPRGTAHLPAAASKRADQQAQERIRIPDDKMEYYKDLAEMYVGDDVSPDFYGWVFPKYDHVAVGTGTVVNKTAIKQYQQVRTRLLGGSAAREPPALLPFLLCSSGRPESARSALP